MTRQILYRLVDQLPDTELHTAARYLQYLSHDEADFFSSDEIAAIEESWQQMQRGEVIPFEEVIESLDPGFRLGS